jgi:hypothetical protein
VAVAVALRWLTAPWLEGRLPYGPLYAAVAVATWFGGWRAGLLASIAGFVATEIVFPEQTVRWSLPSELSLTLLLYGGSCGAIVYFADAHRWALAQANALGHALSETVRSDHDSLSRLRAAEQRFRDAHEASLQGYALLSAMRDEGGAILDFAVDYINPAGAAIAGGVPEDLIDRRLAACYPVARAALFERLREVVLTGNAADFVTQYDGGPAPGRFHYMMVKVGDGAAVAFSALSEAARGLDERPSATERSAVSAALRR